jgi:membrane protease YdiL (CAAX protease family)
MSLLKTLLVFCVTTTAVSFIHYQKVGEESVMIPAVWALGALLANGRQESVTTIFGLTKPQLAIGLKYYLFSTLVIFPLFGGVFLLYYRLGMPILRQSIPAGMPLADWVMYQFIGVGIFEELFFRGYIQTHLEDRATDKTATQFWIFWRPIVASAFLFGVAHVIVTQNPMTFAVFFPGLLFGWLRAKTGSLIAPICSHGTANVFGMMLIRSVS